MWKFGGKIKKEQWLLLALSGAALMILAAPPSREPKSPASFYESGSQGEGDNAGVELQTGFTEEAELAGAKERAAYPDEGSLYEARMEERIRELLKNVEGVGQVDVMMVLKTSEEKVVRVDKNIASSVTKEQDTGGGVREISQSETGETTVMAGGSGQNQPIVEKEICPELSGIIISAQGGGSPKVKAEISEAMEALFGLPAHKIKVLKRVE